MKIFGTARKSRGTSSTFLKADDRIPETIRLYCGKPQNQDDATRCPSVSRLMTAATPTPFIHDHQAKFWQSNNERIRWNLDSWKDIGNRFEFFSQCIIPRVCFCGPVGHGSNIALQQAAYILRKRGYLIVALEGSNVPKEEAEVEDKLLKLFKETTKRLPGESSRDYLFNSSKDSNKLVILLSLNQIRFALHPPFNEKLQALSDYLAKNQNIGCLLDCPPNNVDSYWNDFFKSNSGSWIFVRSETFCPDQIETLIGDKLCTQIGEAIPRELLIPKFVKNLADRVPSNIAAAYWRVVQEMRRVLSDECFPISFDAFVETLSQIAFSNRIDSSDAQRDAFLAAVIRSGYCAIRFESNSRPITDWHGVGFKIFFAAIHVVQKHGYSLLECLGTTPKNTDFEENDFVQSVAEMSYSLLSTPDVLASLKPPIKEIVHCEPEEFYEKTRGRLCELFGVRRNQFDEGIFSILHHDARLLDVKVLGESLRIGFYDNRMASQFSGYRQSQLICMPEGLPSTKSTPVFEILWDATVSSWTVLLCNRSQSRQICLISNEGKDISSCESTLSEHSSFAIKTEKQSYSFSVEQLNETFLMLSSRGRTNLLLISPSLAISKKPRLTIRLHDNIELRDLSLTEEPNNQRLANREAAVVKYSKGHLWAVEAKWPTSPVVGVEIESSL